MKALTRKVTIVLALNLITAGFALAQAVPPPVEPPAAPTPPSPPHIEAAQIAAKEAQERAKIAQKQGELAALQSRLLNIKLPKLPGVPPFSDAGTILVIPTDQMKAEDFSTIMEDMTIMSRIFNKNLQQAHLPAGGGFSGGFWDSGRRLGRFFGQDSHAIEAIFLDGYGAVFMVNVDFPLSPPPEEQKEDKEAEAKKPADPVWAETMKELYQPEDVGEHKKERPEEKYDAEKVENLKTTLIKSLKHAANIRNLKPADSVIITVKGRDVAGPALFFKAEAPLTLPQGSKTTGVYISSSKVAEMSLASSTVLIIRAKKSDIDAFSKDELDFDLFCQRLQIFTPAF